MSTFNLVLTLYEERRLSVAIKNWLGHLAGAKNDAHVVSESTLSLKLSLGLSYFIADWPRILSGEEEAVPQRFRDNAVQLPPVRRFQMMCKTKCVLDYDDGKAPDILPPRWMMVVKPPR